MYPTRGTKGGTVYPSGVTPRPGHYALTQGKATYLQARDSVSKPWRCHVAVFTLASARRQGSIMAGCRGGVAQPRREVSAEC